MKNLAGSAEADRDVEQELTRCGIEIVRGDRSTGEVKTSITGRLEVGGKVWTFSRAWYYWIVSGETPLNVAENLYADPVGRQDIRVAGHCGRPAPSEWITWLTPEGKKILSTKDEKNFDDMIVNHPDFAEHKAKHVFSDIPEALGKPYIRSYHIDSELGLYVFANAIKSLRNSLME